MTVLLELLTALLECLMGIVQSTDFIAVKTSKCQILIHTYYTRNYASIIAACLTKTKVKSQARNLQLVKEQSQFINCIPLSILLG